MKEIISLRKAGMPIHEIQTYLMLREVDEENREHCLEILFAMKRNIQEQLSEMNHAKAQLEYIIKKHKDPKEYSLY